MNYNQREIVLVPFPFSDLSSFKRRPVLIISNDKFNSQQQDIIVLAITSNLFRDEYSIEISDKSLEYGVLPEKSVIKTSKIFSINKESVIKKFSLLSLDKFQEVEKKLIKLFSH